jgi:uncharacterized membrane protein YbhN (UPF0104 family)
MTQCAPRIASPAVVAAVSVAVLGVLAAAAMGPLRTMVTDGVARVGDANPHLLTLASVAFGFSLVATAAAWRTAVAAAGGRVTAAKACAYYGAGSLVNSLTPAHLGELIRFALFARAVPGSDRLMRTAGACGAVTVARTLAYGALLCCALLVLPLPGTALLVPVLVLLAAGTVLLLARFFPGRRLACLLDSTVALVHSPRSSAALLGATTTAVVCRVLAATAVVAAFGIHAPLAAGVAAVAAVSAASVAPLTPGNIGITSAAVALALRTQGIDGGTAVAAGLGFHLAETAAGVLFGAAGVLSLATAGRGRVRRLAVAGASAALVAAAGGAAFFVGLG